MERMATPPEREPIEWRGGGPPVERRTAGGCGRASLWQPGEVSGECVSV